MSGSAAYVSLIQKLYRINVNFPVKMGLENSRALYKLLGNPLDNVPIIHVGGTNGKGSVCLKIAESFRLSNIKTGLFVSPHVSSFRERIQVNGEILHEEDVLQSLDYIIKLCETNNIPATFFELTTALAFHHFREKRCEAVVLEVGLGGRTDATNVITPALSIITSIQRDHTKILGNSLEEIAAVKAGIMKPNVDVIVGPHCPHHVLSDHAANVGAPFHMVESPKQVCNDVDVVNQAIAQSALALLKHRINQPNISWFSTFSRLRSDAIAQGILARPPCRFQIFNKSVILDTSDKSNSKELRTTTVPVEVVLDIAHNMDAIKALVRKVKDHYPIGRIPISLVIGFCADKDIPECLQTLLELTDPSCIFCVSAKHPRALSSSSLREQLRTLQVQSTVSKVAIQPAYDDIRSAVRHAVHFTAQNARKIESSPSQGLVLVCGTFFIMSEARAELGINEPRDGDILHGLLDGSGQSLERDTQECFALPKL